MGGLKILKNVSGINFINFKLFSKFFEQRSKDIARQECLSGNSLTLFGLGFFGVPGPGGGA